MLGRQASDSLTTQSKPRATEYLTRVLSLFAHTDVATSGPTVQPSTTYVCHNIPNADRGDRKAHEYIVVYLAPGVAIPPLTCIQEMYIVLRMDETE